MSAPTAIDGGALEHGVAWWHRPVTGSAAPPGREAPDPAVPGLRAQDPISRLSRQHDAVCREACDPYEIVAVLETVGIDDRRARAEFGVAGTFELAEALWERVPWRPAQVDAGPDPWRLPLWRALARGLVYVLPPALAGLALAGSVSGLGSPPLLVAMVVSICAGQALSVLGHLLVGRGQTRAFDQLAARALTGAGLFAVSATTASALLAGPTVLVAGASGQLAFVLAATVLLVRGRDLLLLATIAPGAATAGAGLALAPPSPPARGLFLLAAGITVVLSLAAAAATLTGRRSGPPPAQALGRSELTVAGWAAGYGLGLSALASLALVAAARGGTDLRMSDVAVSTLPLTATLGMAEFALHRARSRCAQWMLRVRALGSFTATARRELRLMVGGHAAVTGVVAVLVLAVLPRPWPADLIGFTVAYALLGVALLLCTTLLSFGEVSTAAWLALTAGTILPAAVLLLPATVAGVPAAAAAPVLAAGFAVLAHRVAADRFVLTGAHR